jgi:hypothetical protein
MKLLRSATISMLTAILIVAGVSQARALEPRPWLCRDKPVFSSDKPMTYDATRRGVGRWVMTFMRFDPAGGHDGFTVFESQDVNGRVGGMLEPGQWYAVGMFREGSHWICAARAGENHQFVPGIVRDLCYGESEGSCDVKMTVRESAAAVPDKRSAR